MSVQHPSPHRGHDYDDKSGWQMLAEIVRLLLLLVLKGLYAVWKRVRRGLRFLLKGVCIALLWIIDFGILCAKRWYRFWNDRSTQEKVGQLKHAASVTWHALTTATRWLCIHTAQAARWIAVHSVIAGKWLAVHTAQAARWLAVHLWRWARWTSVHAVQGAWLFCKGVVWTIVHLRRALILTAHALRIAAIHTWRALCIAATWTWHTLVCIAQALRRWARRRKAAHIRFRRAGGVRGMLIRWGIALKTYLYNTLEEQDLTPANAVATLPAGNNEEDDEEEDDDDLPPEDEEEALFRQAQEESGGKVHTFGRGFYQALKRIVEED